MLIRNVWVNLQGHYDLAGFVFTDALIYLAKAFCYKNKKPAAKAAGKL